MSKKIRQTLSYNENIGYAYSVDTFNQRLHVELTGKPPANLKEGLLKDAVSEAYDHYNSTHKDNEFIHPDSIAP